MNAGNGSTNAPVPVSEVPSMRAFFQEMTLQGRYFGKPPDWVTPKEEAPKVKEN